MTPGVLKEVKTAIPGTTTVGFYVWFPEGYDEGKDWPWYLHFHGRGELVSQGSPLSGVLKNGMPAYIKSGALKPKAVVIMPQFVNGSLPDRAKLIYDYVLKNYKVADKVHSIGLSFGGEWALEFAAGYPNLIASVTAMCPAVALNATQATAIASVKVPVQLFHAKDDTTIPFARTQASYTLLKAAGANVLFTPIEKGGHSGGWSVSNPAWKYPDGKTIYQVVQPEAQIEPLTVTVEATKLTPEGVWQFKAVPSREAQIMAWDKPATSNVFAFGNTLIVFLPNTGGFTVKATMSTADGVTATGTYTEAGR